MQVCGDQSSSFLDRDQIDRICAALEATEMAKDERKRTGALTNVVRFAFAARWRTTSEVLPLEWRHVDWAGGCVRLDAHTTKNDEGQVFPFTADIEKILRVQLAIHEQLTAAGTICPFVFHRNGGAHRLLPHRVAECLQGRRLSWGPGA